MNAQRQLMLIQQHLVKYLGPPTNVVEVSGSPIPDSPISSLGVAYFAPQGASAPVAFATSGISLFQMQDGRRVEALILLKGEPSAAGAEAIQRLMAQFALFIQSSPPIQPGDVVGAGEELAHFSNMDTVLFLPPIPFVPEFHRSQVAENEWVDLLWLIPVYSPEAEYGVQYGPQALMTLFAAQNLDLTDPRRNQADVTMSAQQAEEILKNAEQNLQNLSPPADPSPRASAPKGDTSNPQADKRRGDPAAKSKPNPTGASPMSGGLQAKPGPRRSRGRVDAPKAKQTVRFDLKASGGTIQKKRPSNEMPALRPKPEPEPTPEEKAEARKKRVEELKAIAKEVAERAKARQARPQEPVPPGNKPPPEAVPLKSPNSPDSTHLRAAARRRGAPKRPLKSNR